MADCRSQSVAHLGELVTPARNNYFYGKLMDELHFKMEQTYFNRKRWLLNRLSLGYGVLCGLNVEAKGTNVVIQPGVAIDGLGREIIVPSAFEVDPRQLTDDCCRPTGAKATGSVLICLAYKECESEMVPVLVGDCETKHDCAPSTICERYCVIVQPWSDAFTLPSCPVEGGLRFNNGKLEPASYQTLMALVSGPCDSKAARICVPLARVDLPRDAGAIAVHQETRPLVYSNALLFELLLCLWAKVEECCGTAPPKDPPVVTRVRFWGDQALTPQEVSNLNAVRLTEADRVTKIEVTFSQRILRGSVVTATEESNASVVVVTKRGALRTLVPGEAELNEETNTITITFRSEPLGPDRYELLLKGEGTLSIRSTDELLLDGDPNPNHVNSLPSGDGTAGGSFRLEFSVSPNNPLTI